MQVIVKGEVECPICGKNHSFVSPVAKSTKVKERFYLLGDCIPDSEDMNTIVTSRKFCINGIKDFSIGVVIRRGQIVEFITSKDNLTTFEEFNVYTWNNIEYGFQRNKNYRIQCGFATGIPEESLIDVLDIKEPFPENYKFMAFGEVWRILSLYAIYDAYPIGSLYTIHVYEVQTGSSKENRYMAINPHALSCGMEFFTLKELDNKFNLYPLKISGDDYKRNHQ